MGRYLANMGILSLCLTIGHIEIAAPATSQEDVF
jgi:hypothetical protein